MVELLQEMKTILSKGDSAAIKEFSEERRKVLEYDSAEGQSIMLDNLDTFLEVFRVLAIRTSDIRGDAKLFSSIEHITDKLSRGYRELLAEYEEISENTVLRYNVIELLKIALESGCPSLLCSFHWMLESEEYMLWKELEIEERVEIYKILRAVLPRIVTKIPKRTLSHQPDQSYNSLIYTTFYEIACSFKPEEITDSVRDLLVDITNYSVDKILDPRKVPDDSSPYYQIVVVMLGSVCWENVDLCVYIMSTLNKLMEAGPTVSDGIKSYTNNCLRNVADKKSGHIDAESLQRQIDVYLKEGKEDQTQATPVLLMRFYSQHPDTIHRNLRKLVATAADMPVQHSIQIVMLLKEVATHNPQVLDAEMLSLVYPMLDSDYFVYYGFESLLLTSRHNPEVIDVSQILQQAAKKPLYLYTVCETLTQIGISKSTAPGKAGEMIGWLLAQCTNPVNFSQRHHMLGCAKAIGQAHKTQLLQFKPLIETLSTDPAVKDIAASILDYLEDRSLVRVTEQVKSNTVQITSISHDLEETTEALSSVANVVSEHSEEIRELSDAVQETNEEVETIRAELAEATIDIQRIDRKTVNTTPKWSHHVAQKLNPEAPADWRLMAKRLGYSNDDLRSWASHENPCMSLLAEWFATHISSEATRAVYIVLKEMSREDAAHIVADALEMAGEMVPVDEPLDLNNPPSVFISYQWGIQDKAKVLKDYLTDAGFSCWLDIGQMGGGDKLYEKLDSGIRAAKVVLNLVTEKYAKSPNCNKEANLSVSLHKPMFPLLMEKMPWPPEGSMGPIFSEYLFVRFFQRENELKAGIYWPEAKMEELLLQLRHVIEPDEKLVIKKMDDWWLRKTGKRIIGAQKQKMVDPVQPDIFISYQWANQGAVFALYQKLMSLGYTCWLDIEQMGAGDSLFDKIDKGIRSCKVVLSCVTEKYSLSLNCKREVNLASLLGKPILPLLLETKTWPPAGPMGIVFSRLQHLNCASQPSLTEGATFNILIILLSQHGVVTHVKMGKNVSSLATTMKGVDKFTRANRKSRETNPQTRQPASQNSSQNSQSCNIL